MQEVEVYVQISGNYCTFSNISFYVMYDITNNIQLEDDDLEYLENFKYEHNECDIQKRKAILVDGVYYVKWEK